MTLDNATMERMCYDSFIAAETIESRGDRIEIALVPPGVLDQRQYCFVIHVNTDPDDDCAGMGGVEQCGVDLAEAEQYYLSRRADYTLDATPEFTP
jgi:hypothetical protein